MIIVTGGAGHIGTNLALDLLASSESVTIVDLRDPITARQHGARWINADVRDLAAMREAFDGADTVYHLAAVISVVGGLGGRVESVNVLGSRVVADAARVVGVGRLVHCSSVHAYDIEAGAGQMIDEASQRSVRGALPAYDRSKAAGEDEVRRVIDRGLDAVMVNPTGVIGRVDEAPSRMGAVLRALWRRRMAAVVAGGFDWVDVVDVVAALRAAAERGRTGENYLVAGHRRSMRDLAVMAAECSGVAVTRRAAPMWSARLCAPVATAIARRTGNPLMPTTEALAAVASFPVINHAKATAELGHAPRPIEATIADLYGYFRERGTL